MPRFVILEHDFPKIHWDLMLESENVLLTWKLAKPPVAGQTVNAQKSFDHRLVCLDYEGPISGNRGHVLRWDAGDFIWQTESEKSIQIKINSNKCTGLLEITQTEENNWLVKLKPNST